MKTWQKPQVNDWHLLWVKKGYNDIYNVLWMKLVKWKFIKSAAFSMHSP